MKSQMQRRVAAPPKVDGDFVSMAMTYAAATQDPANHKRFNRWMKLAGKRFLDDLERCKEPDAPFYFDVDEANNVCDFIEKLPHVEGTWEKATIVLHESQCFFLCQLFGFRRYDGTRRFTVALKSIARKNAKSTEAATIGLYCETCEGENGPQVITAATTGSQARIVFDIAKHMVERTPDLREAFGLEPFANAIACYGNAGTFKPINSKASTQDGLNPSCVILDEIHAHPDSRLVNVLRSAAGARQNPLFLYATTEGYENIEGPWAELRDFAKKVLLGLDLEADHVLIVYYGLDEEDKTEGIVADDDFDEEVWEKANPLMPVNPLLMREMRKEAIEAKLMPARHAEFKIKRLNRSAAAAGGWVNLNKWRKCDGKVDLDFLRDYPCWGGLDLANTSDLCTFRLVWRPGDGIIYTFGWKWVTELAVSERLKKGLVPYATWVNQGWLTVAGKETVDHDLVFDKIVETSEEFNLVKIMGDPWQLKQIARKAETKGILIEEFPQQPRFYHPAMSYLERIYVDGLLATGGDPVLNYCASNLVSRKDANNNNAPDKKRAPDKIDDMTALLEAIGGMIDGDEADDPDAYSNPIKVARR